MHERTDCENCRDLFHEMKLGIHRTEESCTSAHKRIDEIQETVGEMRTDVAKISGQMGPIAKNVEKITSAIIDTGLGSRNGQSEVMLKVLDVIKWLIVASVIGGAIAAVGYYGVNVSAKSHGQQLEIRGQ